MSTTREFPPISETDTSLAMLLNPPDSDDTGSLHFRCKINYTEGKPNDGRIFSELIVKSCGASARLNLNCEGGFPESYVERAEKLRRIAEAVTKAADKLERLAEHLHSP